ncbi:sporulation protein [Kitasatospora sp. DSM 101779]|uniref:sporulation protein n=1 Tax=Kitasatospora sp. DSM 101779 TaxID=2853165 RepID=UPI0021D94A0D|nr:sporulation protein [Kitasatospora sp. DSM 101779]
MFNRLLGAFGVGGPGADTVLSTPTVLPGGRLVGQVNLAGGTRDAAAPSQAAAISSAVSSGTEVTMTSVVQVPLVGCWWRRTCR